MRATLPTRPQRRHRRTPAPPTITLRLAEDLNLDRRERRIVADAAKTAANATIDRLLWSRKIVEGSRDAN